MINEDILSKVHIDKVDVCPLCASTSREKFETDLDATHLITCVACSVCGLIYMDGVVAADDLHIIYNGYNSERNEADKAAELKRKQMYIRDHKYVVDFTGENDKRILDIGCGQGDFLNQFNKDFIKYGVEIDADAYDAGKAKYPDITFSPSIKHIAAADFFDIIIFRGTIQYMTDLKEISTFCSAHLNAGGKIIFLATPNADSLLARVQKENWALFNRIEHRYCFGVKQLQRLFGDSYDVLDYDLPYLKTPYEDYFEDIKKVIAIFNGDRSILYSKFPFYGSMLNLVLIKTGLNSV